VTTDPRVELAFRQSALQLADSDYFAGMTAKDRADALLHHAKMQVRYLVWYQVANHGLFSIDVDHTLAAARENRDGFIEDGYPARIIAVSVVDGQPVAEWIDDQEQQ